MKEIHLTGDYYCVTDSMSVNLAKKRITQSGKGKGEVNYDVIGYYPNFEMVLKRLAEELQKDRLPEAKGIEEAIRIVKATNDEVKKIVSEAVGWGADYDYGRGNKDSQVYAPRL